MYFFNHRTLHSPWPSWSGVLHGDEIAYIFGDPFREGMNYTQKEMTLSSQMMRFWANFARSG